MSTISSSELFETTRRIVRIADLTLVTAGMEEYPFPKGDMEWEEEDLTYLRTFSSELTTLRARAQLGSVEPELNELDMLVKVAVGFTSPEDFAAVPCPPYCGGKYFAPPSEFLKIRYFKISHHISGIYSELKKILKL